MLHSHTRFPSCFWYRIYRGFYACGLLCSLFLSAKFIHAIVSSEKGTPPPLLLKKVAFPQKHNQLLNSVTLIHKCSTSNIPTPRQALHHLQLQREDICIRKPMLSVCACYQTVPAESSASAACKHISIHMVCKCVGVCALLTYVRVRQNKYDLRCFLPGEWEARPVLSHGILLRVQHIPNSESLHYPISVYSTER